MSAVGIDLVITGRIAAQVAERLRQITRLTPGFIDELDVINECAVGRSRECIPLSRRIKWRACVICKRLYRNGLDNRTGSFFKKLENT